MPQLRRLNSSRCISVRRGAASAGRVPLRHTNHSPLQLNRPTRFIHRLSHRFLEHRPAQSDDRRHNAVDAVRAVTLRRHDVVVVVATDGRLRFDLPKDQFKQREERNEAVSIKHIMTAAELRDLEANNVREALAASSGKIYGHNGAAMRLRMKPTTLASRIKALGIAFKT